jgi:hypothetical protein
MFLEYLFKVPLIYFDEAFDILNSRNPRGKGTKAPIKRDNLENLKEKKEKIQEYIST